MSSGSGKHDFKRNSSREDEKQEIEAKPKSQQKKRKNKRNLVPHEIKGDNSNESPKLEMLGNNLDCLAIAEEKDGDTLHVDDKVKAGESFGEGWWKPNSKAGKDYVKGGATTTGLEATGNPTQLKFKDFYGDSEDDSEDEENKVKETVMSGKSSAIGASLKEAFSGLQINKNSDKKPVEEGKQSSSDLNSRLGKCSYCNKEGHPRECSRCHLSSYCNTQCQKSDYQVHKLICRRKATFDMFQSKIPEVLKQSSVKKFGSFEVSSCLDDLPTPNEYAFGLRGHVMAEIIGPYFHLFRHGIVIRDMSGDEIHILFYTEAQMYSHRTDNAVKRYNLGECLTPGNFILLLDTCFHAFLDGTLGIRINNLDEVHFIFKN